MQIITYPNPILEKPASKVKLPLDKETQNLIREMYKFVQKKGVGLAAPQVGKSLQICIINLSEDKALAKKYKTPDFVMINPEIIFESQLKSLMVEGCLSFPEEFWQIWRSANITAVFDTISNWREFINGAEPIIKKQKNFVAKEWLARVILHEVDHLNGKLFINMKGKKLPKDELDSNHKIVD
jgi:peptide deformylase